MSVTFEQSVDDPIVTMIIQGSVDSETIQELHEQMAQRLTEMGVLYAIVDVTGVSESFTESAGTVTLVLQDLRREGRIVLAFVAPDASPDQLDQSEVPVFSSREAARVHITRRIAERGADQAAKGQQ